MTCSMISAVTGSRLISVPARELKSTDTTLPKLSCAGAKTVECALDPGRGGSVEIEIAIDPVDRTHRSQLGEPGINGFADAAEFRVSRIPQRQNGEARAVKARRRSSHELRIGTGGPRRRLAFTPRGRNHHKAALLWQIGDIQIREIDDLGFEAALARELGHVLSQPLRIAGLAREEDRERLGWADGRIHTGNRGLTRVDPGQKASKPGTLDRGGSAQDAIETEAIVVPEGCGLREEGKC